MRADFEAHPHEIVALVGPSGEGKTTLLRIMLALLHIQSGDEDLVGAKTGEVLTITPAARRLFSYVPQGNTMFSGTIAENMRNVRPDATDEEVEQAAKTASAHSFILRLENGYDTMLEGDGINLSQGQRQLLNIARAAVSKAPILVLDEATSSVDTRTEMHIDHGMERLMKNRTTFVIAHRLSTVRNADCIMVLEQGEIIERGTHEQLLAEKGRYYQLYTGAVELD